MISFDQGEFLHRLKGFGAQLHQIRPRRQSTTRIIPAVPHHPVMTHPLMTLRQSTHRLTQRVVHH